jgi:putative Holliday junction resolvase
VRILALDYGPVRTGVAISDATGTLARPLGVVESAASGRGLARLAELIGVEDVERVVVGLPVTLRGEHGEQAEAAKRFVEALRDVVPVPVESFDERFTTDLAEQDDPSLATAPLDARAAAHLLTSYLAWSSGRLR